MNAETLKSAIIYALNHGKAEDLLIAIMDVIQCYRDDKTDVIDMNDEMFSLDWATRKLLREKEENDRYLAEYYSESEQDTTEHMRRYAHLSGGNRNEIAA